MSKKFLQELLNETSAIIARDIRNELDLEETIATFSSSVIKKAVLNQLRFTTNRGKGEAKYSAWRALTPRQRKEVIDYIDKESSKIMGELYRSFKTLQRPGLDIQVRGNKDRFTVSVVVIDKNILEQRIVNFRGQKTIEIGAFQAVKDGYRDILNNLWKKIAVYIQQKSGVKDQAFKAGAFNLEHSLGESVAERRVGQGLDYLYSNIKEVVKSDEATIAVLKSLEIQIDLGYLSTANLTRVKVFVGSASSNKRKSTIEKEILKRAQQSIVKALETKLLRGRTPPQFWRGSDDRITIESKKIIKSFESNAKEGPSLKKTKTNTKLNLSQQKLSKTIKIPVKTNKKDTTFKKKPENKNIGKTSRAGYSAISLMALINQKLPQTVMENMGPPALTNRTGRFASSARVTNIISTRNGFPSIGYTYQKDPYQTFEPGGRQGSIDYDPRKLIDKSIREIATGLLLGRFYTRRL